MAFVRCSRGCVHWGRYGAAGLLLRAPGPLYLVVLRAEKTHQGGTWSVPGGAAKRGEDPLTAAARETVEELGPVPQFREAFRSVDDHGGWAYVTIVADVDAAFEPAAPNWEIAGTRWVTAEQGPGLRLHPGLRAGWPDLTDSGPAPAAPPAVR